LPVIDPIIFLESAMLWIFGIQFVIVVIERHESTNVCSKDVKEKNDQKVPE
jgi:hypothetical protein